VQLISQKLKIDLQPDDILLFELHQIRQSLIPLQILQDQRRNLSESGDQNPPSQFDENQFAGPIFSAPAIDETQDMNHQQENASLD
jgi:hypothetical protein